MSYTFPSGQVAFVTGGARGQGRAHALTLARHGVDVVLVDACQDFSTVPYGMSTKEDLAESVRLIEETGARALPLIADVRDLPAMQAAAERAIAEFGKIDYLVANAGVWSAGGKTHELPKAMWDEMIDINLTGVWHTFRAVLPYMERAKGGRVVATCSGVLRHTGGNVAHYAAAKAGVFSLVKSVAFELAPLGITANAISPSNVGTDMILNEAVYRLYNPANPNPDPDEIMRAFQSVHMTGVGYIQPQDSANVVAFLLCEESRYITGIELPVTFGRTGGF